MHVRTARRIALALQLALISPLARAAPSPASGSAPSAKAPEPPVAGPAATVLFPLRSLGVPSNEASALEATLRNEVAALPEVKMIEAAAVASGLDERGREECLAKAACAGPAASKAGARQFVSGTVSALGDSVLVDLKLVDAQSGREIRRITHPIAGGQELLIEALHAAAVELLAPARFVGRLEVKLVQAGGNGGAQSAASDEDARGAQLFVDGKLVAQLPLAHPVDDIEPGRRAVRVAKEGFHDASLFVEVRFDRTTEAYVDLPHGELAGVAYLRAAEVKAAPPPPVAPAPAPAAPVALAAPALAVQAAPPPRAPWLKIAGWSSLGAGVAGVAIGVALQIQVDSDTSALSVFSGTAYSPTKSTTAAGMQKNIDSELNEARVAFAAGGVLLAAGGAMLLWDVHLDRQQTLTIGAAPALLPGGAAAGVSGKF